MGVNHSKNNLQTNVKDDHKLSAIFGDFSIIPCRFLYNLHIHFHFKNCYVASNSVKENSELLTVCILFFILRNLKNKQPPQKHSLKTDVFAANAVPKPDTPEEGQQLSTHEEGAIEQKTMALIF